MTIPRTTLIYTYGRKYQPFIEIDFQGIDNIIVEPLLNFFPQTFESINILTSPSNQNAWQCRSNSPTPSSGTDEQSQATCTVSRAINFSSNFGRAYVSTLANGQQLPDSSGHGLTGLGDSWQPAPARTAKIKYSHRINEQCFAFMQFQCGHGGDKPESYFRYKF